MTTSDNVGREKLADYRYRGHRIQVYLLGPDLLAYVDGAELSPFYPSMEAARQGGMRHADELEEERAKGKKGRRS